MDLPRSNFFPSGSMSFTLKISSNKTPAIAVSTVRIYKNSQKQRKHVLQTECRSHAHFIVVTFKFHQSRHRITDIDSAIRVIFLQKFFFEFVFYEKKTSLFRKILFLKNDF